MRYCVETGKEIEPPNRSGFWECPFCGRENYKFETELKEDLMQEFLNNINFHYNKARTFQQHVQERLTMEAKDIEGNLETGMIKNGEIKLRQIRYLTEFFEIEGPEHLIVKSLLSAGSDPDQIYRELEKAEEELSKADKTNEEERNTELILKRVIKYFEKVREKSKNSNSSVIQAALHKEGEAMYRESGFIEVRSLSRSILDKTKFPEILAPLERKEKNNYTSDQKFRAFLVHELTHAWLDHSVENWSNSGIYNDIDEIFAYFTGWRYGMELPEDIPQHIYHDTELIEWGARVLKEKNEEIRNRSGNINWIDFGRKCQKRIYEKAAADNSFDRRFIFLRFCLPQKEQKKVEKIRKLDEEFETDIHVVKEIICSVSNGYNLDTKKKNEIKSIANSLHQNKPSEVEKEILNQTIKEALSEEGYPDLNWVSQRVSKKIGQRADQIKKDSKELHRFEEDFADQIKEEEIQKIEKLRRDLEKINERMREISKI